MHWFFDPPNVPISLTSRHRYHRNSVEVCANVDDCFVHDFENDIFMQEVLQKMMEGKKEETPQFACIVRCIMRGLLARINLVLEQKLVILTKMESEIPEGESFEQMAFDALEVEKQLKEAHDVLSKIQPMIGTCLDREIQLMKKMMAVKLPDTPAKGLGSRYRRYQCDEETVNTDGSGMDSEDEEES